jgi:phosphoglycolate phosphatase
MKKYYHWVFDLDGTIIDSGRFYEIAVDLVLREHGLKPTSSDLEKAFVTFNPAELFGFFIKDKEQVEKAVIRFVALNHEHAAQIPAYQGIEELFKYLASKSVRLSVWTGRETSSARAILDATGLAKYFATCVGRSCTPNNKPSPDGLLKILTDFKDHHDDVVMIGDHDFDMLGAKAANVTGISVDWAGRPDVKAQNNSKFHFNQISQLHSWAIKIYGD